MTEPRLDPADATARLHAAGRGARPRSASGLLAGVLTTSWALGVLGVRMVVAPDPLHIDPFGAVDRPTRRRSVSRAA